MSCPSYYLDTFNDPGSGWPVGQGSEYDTGYLNGEYQISVKNLFTWVGVTPGILASDFVVSADVRNISGLDGSYGLLFGMSADGTQLYTFEISPDGSYTIWRYDPASTSWTSLANGSSRYINNGAASNHLVIERIGSSLKAYANGQLLVALNDSNYTGQRSIGVVAEEYRSTNLDIRFDNFMVSDLFCNPSILFSPSTGQKSGIRSGIIIYSSSAKPKP